MLKTVIVLNPAARSQRAAALNATLEALTAGEALIRLTAGPGDARAIANWAVEEGYEQIVAAGGDGTVNEVVNGIVGSHAALGILPLGSVNVFAMELGLPKSLKACWAAIQSGHTREIDVPEANGRAFVQLAGVGLDAQVVQETSWDLKRNLGPLSYLVSATHIASRQPPRLVVDSEKGSLKGSFALVGNGRYYGGPFQMFPRAEIDDGLLDVLVFKNLGYFDIFRYLQGIAFGTHLDMHDVEYFQAPQLTVSSEDETPVEADGEVIGCLPVAFKCFHKRLRVLSLAR